MAISYCYWPSSGQEWHFQIAPHISWRRWALSHSLWHLVIKNGSFTLLLTSSGQEWQSHIATDHLVVKNGIFKLLLTSLVVVKNGQFHIPYWHLVVKNGSFILLLTSSGQEWLFHIAISSRGNCYWHLVSRMAISYQEDKNGNFILLTSSGE